MSRLPFPLYASSRALRVLVLPGPHLESMYFSSSSSVASCCTASKLSFPCARVHASVHSWRAHKRTLLPRVRHKQYGRVPPHSDGHKGGQQMVTMET